MDPEETPHGEEGDADVSISVETPGGRTNLRGESLETHSGASGKVTSQPSEGGTPAEDPEATPPTDTPDGMEVSKAPPGIDPDTFAIEHEEAPWEEGEQYPGWRVRLPRKLGAYIELIRPFTLLAPIFGGLGGCLLALATQDFEGFEWDTLIYGIGTLVLLNAASNCMNAAFDAHIDRINKPYRPIPRGLVTRDEASSLAFALYFLAFVRAILISVEFWALVFLITFITIYYSMPPIRLKKRLWASNVSIALGRGLLGFVAAWAIFGDPREPTPWVIGGIMFIYLVGATTSKDFTDVEGDRRYGMGTLPVVYGSKRAAIITGPFFIVPFILIPIGVLRGHLIDEANYLLVLIVWGLYVMVLLQNHATERDPNFENSPVWKHMYLMLFALQMGFALVYYLDYRGF